MAKSESRGFKKSLYDFSQNTTFHGLRYLTEESPNCRKLMWLLSVLTCLTAVTIQIVERVNYFYSWPVNVNVQVKYNHSIKFPAVTICNQNAFRVTEAARFGRYELLEKIFSDSSQITLEELNRLGATNLSIDELFTPLAHQKEDFITNCVWKRQPCRKEDIRMIHTDNGVCYTFLNDLDGMSVVSSGVDYGLQLTLNVEQYENMLGPFHSAGVKIYLHDAQEAPLVRCLGQAVPPGTHAVIALSYMVINNLPKPHGDCDTKPLRHTDYFTTAGCTLDCFTKLAESRCHCVEPYMPRLDESIPICTLGQYLFCTKPLGDEFIRSLRYQCGCPAPCHIAVYEPSISYAALSNHFVSKLTSSKESKNLTQKVQMAAEVTAKMDIQMLRTLVENVCNGFKGIKEKISNMSEAVWFLRNNTLEIENEMRSVYVTTERVYRYQEFAIQNGFLRARDNMEERTLSKVECNDALTADIEGLFGLQDGNISEEVRTEMYTTVCDKLRIKQLIVKEAKEDMFKLISHYKTASVIFDFKFEDEPTEHNSVIVPQKLLNRSINVNQKMLDVVHRLLTTDFDDLDRILESFKDIIWTGFENTIENFVGIPDARAEYLSACEMYKSDKSVIYTEGFNLPLKVVLQRHHEFVKAWSYFEQDIRLLHQNLDSMNNLIDSLSNHVFPEISLFIQELQKYAQNRERNLSELGSLILSPEVKSCLSAVKNFFRTVEMHGHFINENYNLAIKPIFTLWEMSIGDEDNRNYYNYTNRVLFLRELSDVKVEWREKIQRLMSEDIRQYVLRKDEGFFAAFDELTTHYEDFKKLTTPDSHFLRQNFLQLDIFYPHLSYETISQQTAYDIFALISDIGGALGLFVGASMLTVVEVIDLFLKQMNCCKHKPEKKKTIYKVKLVRKKILSQRSTTISTVN